MVHIQTQTRRWETATRYYECRVYEDLFGQPILMAVNGAKGSRLGMTRIVAAGQEQIDRVLAKIESTRLKHGYRERLFTLAGASRPASDLVQALSVAQPAKRVGHHKVHGARRKRRAVVVHD